ncbi:MAG: hypothetical protein ACLQUY_26075 [Ktedonobacterales bacterium]
MPNPLTVLAAIEAFVGLLIDITFIVTFPQFQHHLRAAARPDTLVPRVNEHVQAGTVGLVQGDLVARTNGAGLTENARQPSSRSSRAPPSMLTSIRLLSSLLWTEH